MAKTSKLPRAMREARRRVEKAFLHSELALFGVAQEPSDVSPAARLSVLEEEITTLHPEDVAGRDALRRRLEDLNAAVRDDPAKRRYLDRYGVAEVTCTRAAGGERIYRMVVTTFPGHENYVYLLVTGAGSILVDVGSGSFSREDILRGMEVVRRAWNEDVRLDSLQGLLITHAHIDHHGDVAYFKEQSGAPVMVHELDAPVLMRFEERMVLSARDLGVFFSRAGIDSAEQERLQQLYLHGKDMFHSVEVERRLRHGDRILGRYEVIHTPGHCPGHICIRVGNVLLVADQVLNPITPSIFPQQLSPFNGLDNYIHGLLRLRGLEGVEHVLPAHAHPIPDLNTRIDEIFEHHQERLVTLQELCAKPRTTAELADSLFGRQEGYNVILALMETGAHLEHLHQYGRIKISNLDRVAAERDPVIQFIQA